MRARARGSLASLGLMAHLALPHAAPARRPDDWPERLREYLATHATRPFDYATWNCCHLARSWVRELTSVDLDTGLLAPTDSVPMSQLNIPRAVAAISARTTAYTPLVEVIANGIDAINETGRRDGKIIVRITRSVQMQLEANALPEIIGFQIEDNGIGFTPAHRDSFDTLYSDLKSDLGGKGYGRLTALKYFDHVRVKSTYKNDKAAFMQRSFTMGRKSEIIVDEDEGPSPKTDTGSLFDLSGFKKESNLDKTAEVIARNLVERLLPYFITEGYTCPKITLEDEKDCPIQLNDLIGSEAAGGIQEIKLEQDSFHLSGERFRARLFKLYAPRHQSNRVSLVAHKREVCSCAFGEYVPEFSEVFYEKQSENDPGRNYVIRAYVFGDYLDGHVSSERGGFEFKKEPDLHFPIGQRQIEAGAAQLCATGLGEEFPTRQEKKRAAVQAYVDKEAPWHKALLAETDLSALPYKASEEQIEHCLQKAKFQIERAAKRDLERLMKAENFAEVEAAAAQVVERISLAQKDDLAHYIILRDGALKLLAKSLEADAPGTHAKESVVHDILFPRKGDSEQTAFLEHNLWLLDERLNFTEYVSSDIPLNEARENRPDILAYGRRVMFRGDNEASNPITVFEIKRPGRDDFANPSSKDDPVAQIIRYVNAIRDGEFKTPKGRKINIEENTPAFGYVICDVSPKVEKWLHREKGFRQTPDAQGWFKWEDNISLYIEVISWDKLLKDARMRNAIFANKLRL